ncbi:hypothetical protein RhiirA1_412992 [Rhizophagus irregularis]|uniref:Uncharacterized protein n=1 Tax=Rhizophagus irregularis TaxID=588596 RepID=A0A2N0S7U5_9GLOM|nr:hypothetical protein RhiirA1_412992 [Rhizophagus irregularis]GET55823.1 hypothetical protein RIR_jg11560.t1 [Rhizophagus irregularis DAOM 181602=DAOM 197198]
MYRTQSNRSQSGNFHSSLLTILQRDLDFKSTASGQFAQKINWNFWTSEEFSSIFQDAIKGKIDASMTNKASKLFNFTRNKCITFCTKLLTIMVTQIFIEWWTPRCRLTVQWESTNGISTSMNLNEKIGQ